MIEKNGHFRLFWESSLLILLTVLLLVQIADPDIWFHLSIGREVLGSMSIPENEFLVYPNADKPGSFHEWGFGLIHYLAHQAGGYWGMSALNALMAALTLYFLYRAARPSRGQEPYFFIALMATVVWMDSRLIYRPEMVLYLALALELFLLEAYLRDRNPKWLLPVPLVGFLLSQAHPSVIFMIAVLGAYLLQVGWELRGELRSALRPAAALGLTVVATLALAAVNPYGIGQIILPFDFLAAKRVTVLIEEFENVLRAGLHWKYFCLAGSAGVALLLARKKRPVDWLFYLVFGYLAFSYVRNIALFALLMYVPLARGIADGVDRFVGVLRRSYRGLRQVWVSSAAWLAALAALLMLLYTPVILRPWGAGPMAGMFPVTAVSVVKEVRPPGRLFNFYDIGGYLGWALRDDYQVFIDGRHYAANRALSVYRAVTTGRQGWQKALDQYGVNFMILQGTYKTSGQLVPIVGILADDPDWTLAARGERALLFIRTSIASGMPGRFRLDKREVWHQVMAEANYVLKHIPSSPLAFLSRGEALLALGRRDLAIRDFETYAGMVPEDPNIRERIRVLKGGR